MAKKAAPRKRKAEPGERIVDVALELAATQGWRDTSLADIAAAAEVSLADLYAHYRSKNAIVEAFVSRVDQAMLAGVGPELLSEPARDRLFDVIMRRFDVLTPNKEGVRAMMRDAMLDPCAVLRASCRLRRSLALILEAAGLNSAGARGVVRVKGLGLVYMASMRAWLRDDSEDMSKTMAALDRALGRIDDLLAFARRGRSRAQPEEA